MSWRPSPTAAGFQERSQSRVIRFDESIVPRTAPEDLHYSLAHRFLRADFIEEPSHAGNFPGGCRSTV